jgi:hypothetical protein
MLQQRADATLKRESDAAKESYRYRLKELQERSRGRELEKVWEQLQRVKREADQPSLFEELQEAAQLQIKEKEEQIAVLHQDVNRTHELLAKERDVRIKEVLPKRFKLREVRVLPLALVYLIPATAEDVRP